MSASRQEPAAKEQMSLELLLELLELPVEEVTQQFVKVRQIAELEREWIVGQEVDVPKLTQQELRVVVT